MSTNEYKPSAPENEESPEGTIIEEKYAKQEGKKRRYTKGKFLGKGGFAKCYEFTSLDTKRVLASKVIPKASLTKNRAKQKLISEIKIHQSINHKNVVGFEHYFEDHENVYILLELCTNQTMNELLRRRKRLTELEVQCYMNQILDALKYLHTHRIIHRDLKLGNLFLNDKMEIKLGDFGLAAKLDFEGERKKTICGTPNYIAPEILEGKTGHSYEVDIWSLGVICYTLLIGKPPFETNDVKTTYRRIRMNAYSFPEHVTISPNAKDLITKILNTNPAKRPTIDEIMEHPFMSCGYKIPNVMPVSTLACPPSSSYLKQFVANPSLIVKEKDDNIAPNTVARFENTAPSAPVNPSLVPVSTVVAEHRQPMKERRGDTVKTERERFFSSNPKNGYELGNVNNNNVYDSAKKVDSMRLQTAPCNLTERELVYPTIWVKKWVDYSSKYGMGYILSNGSVGVYFNDSTKILMYAEGKFEYIERKGAEKVEVSQKHTLIEYPKELQKKVTLLNHFKSYLEGENQKKDKNIRFEGQNSESQNFAPGFSGFSKESGIGGDNVYVKKWMRSKHAIMFRLSNKVVQVIFQDQTEILLSSEQRVVTYVNKKHERLNYPLSSALESNNQEMGKRLKYTKDILTQLLNGNKEAAASNKYATENANLRKTLGPKTSTSTAGFGSPITNSNAGMFSRMGSYKQDDMLSSDINMKSIPNFIRSNTDGHNPSLSTNNFFAEPKNFNI